VTNRKFFISASDSAGWAKINKAKFGSPRAAS
jgi:hypothetical protein